MGSRYGQQNQIQIQILPMCTMPVAYLMPGALHVYHPHSTSPPPPLPPPSFLNQFHAPTVPMIQQPVLTASNRQLDGRNGNYRAAWPDRAHTVVPSRQQLNTPAFRDMDTSPSPKSALLSAARRTYHLTPKHVSLLRFRLTCATVGTPGCRSCGHGEKQPPSKWFCIASPVYWMRI